MSSSKIKILPKTSVNEALASSGTNDLCVFLMNQSGVCLEFSQQQKASVTAQEILNDIYRELPNQNIDNNKELKFDQQFKRHFAIWVTSTYLELQLQPNHKPFAVLANWDNLLSKYGPSELMDNQQLIEKDEPILSFQRDVFSSKVNETTIGEKDIGVLRLLYLEAKLNVLDGRYPSDCYEKLAAIQAAIDLGPFKKDVHTIEFFRQRLNQYVPCNYTKANDNNRINTLIRTLSRNSHSTRCAQKIVQEFQAISKDELDEYELLRRYMEICWFIPSYGSAYFSAQIEKPVKSGLASLRDHFDQEVWVAINREGVHLISKESTELLLSVGFENLCYAIGCPKSSNPDCIPCLFIEIPDNSNNKNILQIFSRQVKLIEALIISFIEDAEKNEDTVNHNIPVPTDCTDGSTTPGTTSSSASNNGFSFKSSNGSMTPCNKKKLSFATFDTSGHCINKTGSWVRKNMASQKVK